MTDFSGYIYNKNKNYIEELKRYFTDYENSFDPESCLFAIESIRRQTLELKELYYSIPVSFIQDNDPNRTVLEALYDLSKTEKTELSDTEESELSNTEKSDISSSESSRENTPTEYNVRKGRRNFPYKIIIDTHGCVHRNEKKLVPFPFGALKYYAKPGEIVLCKNTRREINSICEGKHRLYPYDIISNAKYISNERHIEIDNMHLEFNPNRPKDRLRNIYFCRGGGIKPLYTHAELADIFDLGQDGETRLLSIHDLFLVIIDKLQDDYPDIPMDEYEIIISSCMGYCDKIGNKYVKTRARNKIHKPRTLTRKKRTSLSPNSNK